jgi:hypothetical protein
VTDFQNPKEHPPVELAGECSFCFIKMKNRKQAAIAFAFGHFSYSTVKNRAYARSILPERRHLEQTYI